MRMDFLKSSFLLFFQLLIMQILVLNRIKTSAKSMKRQSTLLVLREMQLKTSMRYQHTNQNNYNKNVTTPNAGEVVKTPK